MPTEFVIKDYETICPECGRFCDNGYCYECGINLDTPLYDEEITIDSNELWDRFENDLEDYLKNDCNDLWNYYYDGMEE